MPVQVEEELGQKLETHFRYLSDSREQWSMQSKHKAIGHRVRDCAESETTRVGVGGTSSSFRMLLLRSLPTIHSAWNSAHLLTLPFHILPCAPAEAKAALHFSLLVLWNRGYNQEWALLCVWPCRKHVCCLNACDTCSTLSLQPLMAHTPSIWPHYQIRYLILGTW